MQTKIINLFGGPGCKKSTTSAFLFWTLKKLGKNVEIVTEYAKDLVYQEKWDELKNQLGILSEQYRRQCVALNKVEFIVTDSPLLLTYIYNKDDPKLNEVALKKYNEFSNINFFLVRSKDYARIGRTQTLAQAVDIDNNVYKLLKELEIPFTIVNSEEEILPWLML